MLRIVLLLRNYLLLEIEQHKIISDQSQFRISKVKVSYTL